ncbi:MAG: HNH endonuclease [Labilithrix sp.]
MIQQRLSNEELLSTLSATWREEGVLVARVIVMLMEVEDRRLHLELACSSMFDFCTRRLGMSEGEAFRRITAARLSKRFPPVLEAVRKQRVHLSSLVLLRDLFTRENVDELLAAAAGKTKRAVQELVAKLAPRPDVPASIRRLPQSRVIPTAAAAATTVMGAVTTAAGMPLPRLLPDVEPIVEPRVVSAPTSPLSASRAVAAQLVPLAEARHKVQFTASSALREKLERAQSLMRHRNVDGDLAVVVERALDLLITKLEKEKHAAPVPAPAPVRSSSHSSSRSTPPSVDRTHTAPSPRQENVSRPATATVRAAVRREVVRRDGEQCTFVSPSGERCPARTLLELDHRHPRALGGASDASNLRVLCRSMTSVPSCRGRRRRRSRSTAVAVVAHASDGWLA